MTETQVDTRLNREPNPLRLYAIVREDLDMTPGKIASQAGHAYLDTYLKALEDTPENATEYKLDSHGIKVCLRAKNLNQLIDAQQVAEKLGIPNALITDSGYTCFEGKPTITALGLGPSRKEDIQQVTKKFQLFK